ncbi:unnamed protein product, partial [marine sediment metagenome]
MKDMYNYKKLIGELFGAVIAVAWITWALLWPGNMVGLVIAISITILLGTISGGLLRATINNKRLIGELLGAAIAVVWVSWALLTPGNMLGLVIALSLTIVFGTISGGLLKLS